MLFKLFKGIKREGTFANSFFEARIAVIAKSNKGATKKRITDQYLS
jgi:hypothetical protein